MVSKIQSLFAREHITQIGFLPIAETQVINPRLLPQDAKTAIMVVVPYDCGEIYTDGVSAYAHILDYHRYFAELYERMLPALRDAFPGKRFYGFADHSPINEKLAAAKAGLGIIGRHSLLINPLYGSYVFLGSLLTDMEIPAEPKEIEYCTSCTLCQKACPGGAVQEKGISPDLCLSALSQKKKLTEDEKTFLRTKHIAWGCDRCQEVCPHNRTRLPSPVPFFLAHRHGNYTSQEVASMDDTAFSRHAFSWRGRTRIVENLQNLELTEEN